MPGVFLSYRRTDSDFALEIYNSLRGRWGRDQIFWDAESIEGGAKWADTLRQAVRTADAVLALIGPDWTTVKNADGIRRLDAPRDWVRQEIAEAFETKRTILPILAPGVKAPRRAELPEPLAPLASLQAMRMEHRRFATRLIQALEKTLGPIEEGAALELDPLRGERLTRLLTDQTHRLQIRAVELVEQGAFDRALEELNAGTGVLMALLDFAPADTMLGLHQGYLYKTVGQAYEGAGQQDQADRYFTLAQVVFERVRDLGSMSKLSDYEHAGAINGLGAVYQHRGDPVAAMRAFRRAIELNPDYEYAWHDLAAILLWLAEKHGLADMPAIRDAMTQLETCRKSRAGHAKPGLGAGSLARLQRWADDLLKRVKDPDLQPSAEDWMSYAYRHLQAGDAELAAAPLDQAIETDPSLPEPWLYRGAVRIGMGQLDEGLADIERSLALRPGMALAYYNGACGHALKGDADKALEWLEEAVRREPGRREEAAKDPHFESLRELPRFTQLVGRVD